MTRIQIRRDTSNNWATYNPILADGEFALETDTRKLKIGNGEQPYTELAYQGGGVTDTYTKAETDDLLDTKQDKLVAPTGNLKYWTGTEEAYTGLATKDADTLYRTTDTNKVFLGTIQIGGNA